MRWAKLSAAGILVATSLAVAAPAQAALSDCSSNQVCLWGNNDFVWMIAHRAAGATSVLALTGDGNNAMDSWANKSANYDAAGYGNSNGTGDCQTFGRNSNDNNVSPANSDEVSSWVTSHGC